MAYTRGDRQLPDATPSSCIIHIAPKMITVKDGLLVVASLLLCLPSSGESGSWTTHNPRVTLS